MVWNFWDSTTWRQILLTSIWYCSSMMLASRTSCFSAKYFRIMLCFLTWGRVLKSGKSDDGELRAKVFYSSANLRISLCALENISWSCRYLLWVSGMFKSSPLSPFIFLIFKFKSLHVMAWLSSSPHESSSSAHLNFRSRGSKTSRRTARPR